MSSNIQPAFRECLASLILHGTTAYELDAFHPEVLKSLVRDSIQHHTDMEILNANLAIEDRETENTFEMDYLLDDIKEKVRSLAEGR